MPGWNQPHLRAWLDASTPKRAGTTLTPMGWGGWALENKLCKQGGGRLAGRGWQGCPGGCQGGAERCPCVGVGSHHPHWPTMAHTCPPPTHHHLGSMGNGGMVAWGGGHGWDRHTGVHKRLGGGVARGVQTGFRPQTMAWAPNTSHTTFPPPPRCLGMPWQGRV